MNDWKLETRTRNIKKINNEQKQLELTYEQNNRIKPQATVKATLKHILADGLIS